MVHSIAETPALSHNAAWQAVRDRDPRFDGRLVFAVQTTGVFCRPSCPARRPHRKNVQFFENSQEATKAGFRPCRRCHPESAAGTPAERAIRDAVSFLHDHSDQAISLDSLARQSGLSKFHFLRLFTKVVGMSPRAYQRAERLQRVRTALRNGAGITKALQANGGSANGAVYRENALGMTPTHYRRQGEAMTIAFATAACKLGRVLVAMTERGVCAVLLGDSDATIERELREEFASATIDRKETQLGPAIRKLIHTIDGRETPPAAIPVDLRGTVFQMRVWEALRKIPRGETRTYAQIAEKLGLPQGARAVAGACARNRVAVIVPCHRVVRADKQPSGYRWGLARKSALLRAEAPKSEKP
jgi:AraC family transcriptional regulator, regulatory protein of adaptative response / methylated-DNA-[protein]-cysteine methyltransferase